jgi:hypothetical protein
MRAAHARGWRMQACMNTHAGSFTACAHRSQIDQEDAPVGVMDKGCVHSRARGVVKHDIDLICRPAEIDIAIGQSRARGAAWRPQAPWKLHRPAQDKVRPAVYRDCALDRAGWGADLRWGASSEGRPRHVKLHASRIFAEMHSGAATEQDGAPRAPHTHL